MKGKRSFCMNRTGFIFLSVCVLVFSVHNMAAQTFERVERRNLWNLGRNSAGIRMMDTVSISYAEIAGNYTGGGLKHSYESSSSWTAGVQAETIMHLKKFSMSGGFAFSNFSGKAMCGSVSARPGYFPVEIIEFVPGNKTRQDYSLYGNISVDMGRRLKLGGGLKYKALNYVKSKDLRHTNFLMDIELTPSVIYSWGEAVAGLSYVFRKTSESVEADEMGVSSENYYAFLNKGMMYGRYGVWDMDGLHLAESGVSGFPVHELYNGVALQLQWRSFYGDIEYLHSFGKSGEKEVYWFEFPSDGISATLGYRYDSQNGNIHLANLNFGFSRQVSREFVIDKIIDGGVTLPVTYGSNLIYTRQKYSLAGKYMFDSERFGVFSEIRMQLYEELSSQIYPYLYYGTTESADFTVGGRYTIGKFDIGMSLASHFGGVEKSERLAETGISVGDYADFLEEYYNLEKEYVEATRLSVAMSCRYNFYKGLYLEAAGFYTRGINVKILQPDRFSAGLSLGYVF